MDFLNQQVLIPPGLQPAKITSHRCHSKLSSQCVCVYIYLFIQSLAEQLPVAPPSEAVSTTHAWDLPQAPVNPPQVWRGKTIRGEVM